MPPINLIDTATLDTSRTIFDLEAIREVNPQRFEMEHLTGVVQVDYDNHQIVGYKDVRRDEFWVRGHMPEYPLMPGVLICEAAAQLCSFYCHLIRLADEGFLGFGGMEEVRFRGQVRPGDRLIVAAKAERLNRRKSIFETQGFVGNNMVFHGKIIGVTLNPLPTERKPKVEKVKVATHGALPG
jgi:3-hydroxyacyl-[acyl-carrier-protein] dehydratase